MALVAVLDNPQALVGRLPITNGLLCGEEVACSRRCDMGCLHGNIVAFQSIQFE